MTIAIIDEEVQAIKAREEQATFGPWDADPPTWGIVQRGRPLPIVYGNAHLGISAVSPLVGRLQRYSHPLKFGDQHVGSFGCHFQELRDKFDRGDGMLIE